jgi:hypothetical protein
LLIVFSTVNAEIVTFTILFATATACRWWCICLYFPSKRLLLDAGQTQDTSTVHIKQTRKRSSGTYASSRRFLKHE